VVLPPACLPGRLPVCLQSHAVLHVICHCEHAAWTAGLQTQRTAVQDRVRRMDTEFPMGTHMVVEIPFVATYDSKALLNRLIFTPVIVST
jgi:hypothetical protein